jgi:hypothetical protein
MKLEALGLLLCTTILSGFAIPAQADVHVGIGIGVVPPVVVAPPVYYAPTPVVVAPPVYYAPPPVYDAPPPPVYYGPGIVVDAWGGHDWRDHRWHDDRWGHDRWHDRGDHRR